MWERKCRDIQNNRRLDLLNIKIIDIDEREREREREREWSIERE